MTTAKESKVLFMPDRSGEQLASAVAKALRSAGAHLQNSQLGRQDSDQAVLDVKQATAIDVSLRNKPARTGEALDTSELCYLELKNIKPGAYQTRERIAESELDGLVESIISRGVIQPVVVRALLTEEGEELYELVAGERRLRAAAKAGLEQIPAFIQELSNQEALELAIIENAQREDLNPVEEAVAFKRLLEEFRMSQADVAKAVGKNRATIANALRLLQLEPEIIQFLKQGKLSAGHGRALLQIDDSRRRLRIAERAAEEGTSVRALEKLVQRINEVGNDAKDADEEQILLRASLARAESKIADLLEIEAVNLRVDSQGRRRLNLTFDTEAAWRRFMGRIRD